MAIKAEIIGNLGHDAVTRSINGREYLSFDIAPSQGRDAGDTMWVSCLYGATKIGQWLTKGRQVFVRGDYRDKLYTRRDGTAGIDRSLMVTELELTGGRDEGPRPALPQPQPAPAGAGADAAPPADNPDDDLPF